MTGSDSADHAQGAGCLSSIACTYRIPILRRICERRKVLASDHSLREHGSECPVERGGFRRQPMQGTKKLSACIFERDSRTRSVESGHRFRDFRPGRWPRPSRGSTGPSLRPPPTPPASR
jgi:hypothetical protein